PAWRPGPGLLRRSSCSVDCWPRRGAAAGGTRCRASCSRRARRWRPLLVRPRRWLPPTGIVVLAAVLGAAMGEGAELAHGAGHWNPWLALASAASTLAMLALFTL